MNRLRSTSLLLIAVSTFGGVSVLGATPPKGQDSVSGSKELDPGSPAKVTGAKIRTVDPIRSGVSEAGWLDALRHVQVTELQAPLITKIVRTYLEQVEHWRQTMGLELESVITEIRGIREAGGDIPPELTTRVRMIRGAMPKWNVTQQRIISELAPTQVESLLLEIDRYKARQQEIRRVENRRRAMRNAGKAKSVDAVEPPGAGAATVGASGVDSKPPAPKPWGFIQSETPTESVDQAEAPTKTDG